MASSPPSPLPEPHNSSAKQENFYFFFAGLALIILIALVANAVAVGHCAWFRRIFSGRPPPAPPNGSVPTWIPAFKYSKEEEEKEEAEAECAVCLSALADGEMVRELLQCGHTFHVACIDLWFRSNASCPMCRSTVLPTPPASTEMSSPEAILARRVDGLTMRSLV